MAAAARSSAANRRDEPRRAGESARCISCRACESQRNEPWLTGIKAWRKERLTRLRYDGAQYERPELAWTQRVFSQYQMLIWERRFYDPEKRVYTVNRFLDGLTERIGPIDAVLIWHVYPNIGVDDRNQFDLLRDLPGGIPACARW